MKPTLRTVVVAWSLAGTLAWAGTAQITGTIVDEETRLPLAGMCAEAYGLTTDDVESEPTGSDGKYVIPGLEPDTFQLVAHPCEPPNDHALVEYKQRRRSFHGAHDGPAGARLIRLRVDGQVKRNVDFAVPRAGHIEVTVVHDVSGLPAPDVIVRPLASPQPPRGSLVVTGFYGVSDGNGLVTLDVAPGASMLVSVFGTTYLTGPTVVVGPDETRAVEIRIP